MDQFMDQLIYGFIDLWIDGFIHGVICQSVILCSLP